MNKTTKTNQKNLHKNKNKNKSHNLFLEKSEDTLKQSNLWRKVVQSIAGHLLQKGELLVEKNKVVLREVKLIMKALSLKVIIKIQYTSCKPQSSIQMFMNLSTKKVYNLQNRETESQILK